jgi:hypothetical protein
MAHRNTGMKLVPSDCTLVEDNRLGPGAEALRRMTINRLRDHVEAFYKHGRLPDLLLLCAAFDLIEGESLDWSPERAWLVDALFMICKR